MEDTMTEDEIVGQALAKLDDEADPNKLDALASMNAFSASYWREAMTDAVQALNAAGALPSLRPNDSVGPPVETLESAAIEEMVRPPRCAAGQRLISYPSDRSSFGPRVEVTAEMRYAGLQQLHENDGEETEEAAACVFRAMHAAAPVPLVSEAENALRRALLRIVGDMPSPDEDPWERCRGIACAALGYARPKPLPGSERTTDLINAYAEIARLHDALKVRTDEREQSRIENVALGQMWAGVMAEVQEAHAEIARLRAMLPAEGAGPNYHGPTKDGKAVDDPVHERFHESVQDVLAGKVMQPARDQMRKALDGVPAEKVGPNIVTRNDDPRRMGWRG
jgi:hypothetical protein